MIILPVEESVFSLQKCCLSSALIGNWSTTCHMMNYAIIQISPDSKCVCKVVWRKDLHPSFCQVDISVVTFEDVTRTGDGLPCKTIKRTYNSVLPQHIQIVPLSFDIKVLSVSVVFENAKTVGEWQGNMSLLLKIIRNILRLYVVADSSIVYVKNLRENLKIGVNCIIIHHITEHGAVDAPVVGKITSASKLSITKLLSKKKFEQIQYSSNIQCLGALDGPYQELKQIITCQITQERSTGIKSCRQVLLVGPQGCGKTSLVQKVTADCGAVLLAILGPEVCSPKPGDTEETLRQLFKEASELAIEGICVILLDEVDSLCPRRDRKESASHVTRMTTQLLTLLEQADQIQGLVVVATTNRPFALDPAVRRPGRLETEIYIGVPSENQRREILKILVKPVLSPHLVDSATELCNNIASLTPGYVGADLSLLCQDVAHRQYLRKEEIYQSDLNDWLDDFRRAVAKIRPSSLRGGVGVITVQPHSLLEIGGLDSVKHALRTAVEWPLLHPEAFARLTLPQPRGVLLYGPPGCAKTTLARALATSTNTTFLSVSAAELYSPFVGDAERIVLELFLRARLGAPSILFIDEIDALVGSRTERERGVQERVLSAFLTEMDGIGFKLEKTSAADPRDIEKDLKECSSNGVIVIAATNRPDMVDDALLRPGRFDKMLYVPPPDVASRLDILRILLAKTPLGPCVDLPALAAATKFYSGADLMNLCKEAALHALTEGGMETTHVQPRHFLQALKELCPSVSQHMLDWYHNYNNTSSKEK